MTTTALPTHSVYDRLEPLLAQVSKPIQYVGGEVNSVSKAWDDTEVRWALMYPDAYEVGLPNQGVMILYDVLNERADAFECEPHERVHVTADHLQYLFQKAKVEYVIDEELLQKMHKLDQYLQTRFKLAFGNQIGRAHV